MATMSASTYGYGDAVPDIAKYGYEPTNDIYGYGDGAPTQRRLSDDSLSNQRTQRRSSLKTSNNSRTKTRRRASISYNGETKTERRISFNKDVHVQFISPIPGRKQRRPSKEEEADLQEKVFEILSSDPKEKEHREAEPLKRRRPPANYRKGSVDSVHSVLDVQKAQKNRGKFDDDHIREIYQFHTLESQVEATERAEKYEKEVRGYMKETRRMCRRMHRRMSC